NFGGFSNGGKPRNANVMAFEKRTSAHSPEKNARTANRRNGTASPLRRAMRMRDGRRETSGTSSPAHRWGRADNRVGPRRGGLVRCSGGAAVGTLITNT